MKSTFFFLFVVFFLLWYGQRQCFALCHTFLEESRHTEQLEIEFRDPFDLYQFGIWCSDDNSGSGYVIWAEPRTHIKCVCSCDRTVRGVHDDDDDLAPPFIYKHHELSRSNCFQLPSSWNATPDRGSCPRSCEVNWLAVTYLFQYQGLDLM